MIFASTLTLLTLWGRTGHVAGDAKTFSPAAVTDSYGNSADAASQVTWASLPDGDPYVTDTSYNAKGLAPIYSGAKTFISVVQPNEVPYDLIQKLVDGTFDFGTEYQEIVDYALGIAIVIGFGILFVIVFPIIGLLLCCCRCCECVECCGGKSVAIRSEQSPFRCSVFSFIVFILTVLMGVGMLMTFVTNDTVTGNIDDMTVLINSNLEDLKTYLSNTAADIEYATTTSFNFTSQVIIRDLDNIGYLVGVPIRDTLASPGGGGVDDAINSIVALDSTIQSVASQVFAVNTSVAAITAAASNLSSHLSSVKSDIDAALADASCTGCGSVDTSGLTLDFNPNDLPDISSEVSTIDTVLANNLTELALLGKATFDDIPDRVENETETVVSDIKDLLNDFINTLNSEIGDVLSLPNNVSSQIDDIQESLNDYKETGDKYNKFRWYGGCGLSAMVLMVCLLQWSGLCVGGLNYERRKLPTERSGMSSCGGHLLIGATIFIFVFSWLLMLLTTITFGIGANMEKCVCEPLTDDSYTIFKELLDEPGGLFDEYFLGQTLLNNGSIPLKFSDVLEGCKQNGGAVSVLKLDTMFDLEKVTDYTDSIDIQSKIDLISVDFSSVSILSSDTQNQLNDFKSGVNINFTQFTAELNKNATQVDLTSFAADLRTAAAAASDPSKTALQTAADDLEAIYNGSYATMIDTKNQLLTDVTNLESAASTIPTDVDNLISAAQASENYIQANGSQLVTTQASAFANRILGIADQFTNQTLDVTTNEVGSCYPIWQLWDSLVGTALCKYVIDVLNGFWYSVGWSLLCMVLSVIFNIKLAKHFRRAEELGHDYETTSHPAIGDNKVFPA